MTSYAVTKEIGASPDAVWTILTDASRYTEWNPTIVSLDGTIAEGQTIALVSTVNPKRTFKLKVSDVDAPNSMVWWDGMPLGLFKGVRTFTVQPQEGGGTTFSMEEVYSGALAGMITKSIPDMTDSFEQFAQGLKEEAEKGA